VFSDVDVGRARLLHHHPLHQCRPDASYVVPGDKAFFTAKESGCPLTK
jgi:hypothetical protein